MGRTEWFEINEGLWQGSVLSPTLFNVVMDELLTKVEPNNRGKDTRTLVYADDVLIWGEDTKEVQDKVDRWNKASQEIGLKISQEKSESLVVKRKKKRQANSQDKIQLEGIQLKNKADFKYLGSIITTDAKLDKEVTSRLQQADKFYQLVRKLLWNESFPQKCKILLYKTYYVPILTYGAVTWTVGGKEESQLEAAQMKFLRSIKGVTKMDRINSKVIRKELGIERLLFKLGRERLRWFGHMKRMGLEMIPRQEYEKSDGEKRRVGRPRGRWRNLIKEDVAARKESWNVLHEVRLWEDKRQWRNLVEQEEEEDDEETLSLASSIIDCFMP